MGKWAKRTVEIMQLITPDGETFDLTSESKKGNWVLEASGFGMPDIDYITQQGPFQHGVSARDYRLKPRAVQLLLRQQACDRDDYWDRRTELLNALRPNRDPVGLSGALLIRSQTDLEGELRIYSLCEFNNELYLGTYAHGLLFVWDGAYQCYQVASQLNGQTYIWDLIVYDDGGGTDELYGSTGGGGRLFKWNGTDAWAQVCAQLNAQTNIYDMVEFDDGLGGGDQIFAGTGAGGRLFHYNVGGAAWAQDCAQLGAETDILSLCVYDDGGGDDLYGGTSPNGNLYRYNPAGPAWVQACAQLGAETAIQSLAVYNGRLYGGTSPNGKLYRYDVGGGAWEEVAPQYGAITFIISLVVYQGRLYGTTETGEILRWNNTDAWEAQTGVLGTEYSSIVFNNRLFTGSAYLIEYIRRANQTSLPCTVLRRVLSDGSIRDLCVHIQKGPEFGATKRGWDEHSLQEVIRLFAPNPVLYDPTEQDGPTYTMDPTATGSVNESQDVTYAGTWEEHPTFVITGPINNPIIRNEDTDEFIELDYNIAAGRVITITLTPGNQTVVDNLDINRLGTVTPESNLQSFHLAPDPEVTGGTNEISIQGTGTNANTDFSFTYYNRYIGI